MEGSLIIEFVGTETTLKTSKVVFYFNGELPKIAHVIKVIVTPQNQISQPFPQGQHSVLQSRRLRGEASSGIDAA